MQSPYPKCNWFNYSGTTTKWVEVAILDLERHFPKGLNSSQNHLLNRFGLTHVVESKERKNPKAIFELFVYFYHANHLHSFRFSHSCNTNEDRTYLSFNILDTDVTFIRVFSKVARWIKLQWCSIVQSAGPEAMSFLLCLLF